MADIIISVKEEDNGFCKITITENGNTHEFYDMKEKVSKRISDEIFKLGL